LAKRVQAHGGSLKSGNTKNVGRKPAEVKEFHVLTAGKGAELIRKIVEFRACIPTSEKHKNGKPIMRPPTMDEWKWANEISHKYGVGSQQLEVSASDEGAVVVKYTFD